MTGTFKAIIASLPALCYVTGYATETNNTMFERLRAGENQTVVVYGTSLTAGGAWTLAIQKWFNAYYPGKVTFLNSGSGGKNSDWGLEHVHARVASHKPDLVFIEFSYNDAGAKPHVSLERCRANLDGMVRAIRSENPHCQIVLQVMNPAWDAPNGNRSGSARAELESYNEVYRRYAAEMKLPLLDHFPAWKKIQASDPAKFQAYIPDGCHPSKEGSMEVTWPGIEKWLESARAH